jgi:hypothetical protein
MSDSNVVALPGYSVPSLEPVQDVIDILEKVLEKARAGKIGGIAVVEVERDPSAFETRFYADSNKHTLAAGIMSLHWQIGRRMSEAD